MAHLNLVISPPQAPKLAHLDLGSGFELNDLGLAALVLHCPNLVGLTLGNFNLTRPPAEGCLASLRQLKVRPACGKGSLHKRVCAPALPPTCCRPEARSCLRAPAPASRSAPAGLPEPKLTCLNPF